MTLEGIGLFSGLKARMDYLNKSQTLTAQNIANADTPNYQPKELKEFDFSRILKSSRHDLKAKVATQSIQPLVTNPAHVNAAGGERQVKSNEQKVTFETAPSGNAVDLEEQMIRATSQAQAYDLTLNIMRKNVQMVRLAVTGNR